MLLRTHSLNKNASSSRQKARALNGRLVEFEQEMEAHLTVSLHFVDLEIKYCLKLTSYLAYACACAGVIFLFVYVISFTYTYSYIYNFYYTYFLPCDVLFSYS